MQDKQYTYAVARIRSKEMTLLTRQTIEQLMTCKTFQDCMRLLGDKGWQVDGDDMDAMFTAERNKTWDLMKELVEDISVLDIFLIDNDFHNLKATIKQACVGKEVPGIFMTEGKVKISTMRAAIEDKKFDLLPEEMRKCAEVAYELQLKTNNSQMCDVVIDHAALMALYKAGKASGEELFKGYAEMKVAAADIAIAIRSAKTGKDREFLNAALVEIDTLNIVSLAEAAVSGIDAIYEYLETTVYQDAISAIKKSPSDFERWCDNAMITQIRPQIYNPFTISPLAAYIIARENEMKSVRILLSGKVNELPEESIRERMREMYV